MMVVMVVVVVVALVVMVTEVERDGWMMANEAVLQGGRSGFRYPTFSGPSTPVASTVAS